jgi:hypothetical protein
VQIQKYVMAARGDTEVRRVQRQPWRWAEDRRDSGVCDDVKVDNGARDPEAADLERRFEGESRPKAEERAEEDQDLEAMGKGGGR